MKHLHHVIPKHIGGTDDPSNLIELTVEEHAEAHRKLYEEFGRWQDLLAWKGLSGVIDAGDCALQSIIQGAKKGAAITNKKRWGDDHQKNPTQKWLKPGKPSPYEKGIDGRKIRENRMWYNNGVSESQFGLDKQPEGWIRGRLKSVMKKTNPNVLL